MIFREVEDRDLILRAGKGDVEAYNVLVSRWEKRVYNYLLRTVRNREDALDLCQDTFLGAEPAGGPGPLSTMVVSDCAQREHLAVSPQPVQLG